MKKCIKCNKDLEDEKYDYCYDCWFDKEYGNFIDEDIKELLLIEENGIYYIYLLECEDENEEIHYYCGYTSRNPKRRLKEHIQSNDKRHYTAKQKSVKLVYFEECENKEEAIKREREIKKLGGRYKRGLIDGMRNMVKENE